MGPRGMLSKKGLMAVPFGPYKVAGALRSPKSVVLYEVGVEMGVCWNDLLHIRLKIYMLEIAHFPSAGWEERQNI